MRGRAEIFGVLYWESVRWFKDACVLVFGGSVLACWWYNINMSVVLL